MPCAGPDSTGGFGTFPVTSAQSGSAGPAGAGFGAAPRALARGLAGATDGAGTTGVAVATGASVGAETGVAAAGAFPVRTARAFPTVCFPASRANSDETLPNPSDRAAPG